MTNSSTNLGSSGNLFSFGGSSLSGTYLNTTISSINNITVSNSGQFLVYNGTDFSSISCSEIHIKLFLSDTENYYELVSGELFDFPDGVDFNNLEDIMECILMENAAEVLKGLVRFNMVSNGEEQEEQDRDITFKIEINKNGVISNENLMVPLSSLDELL
jgi:hypothetical protein